MPRGPFGQRSPSCVIWRSSRCTTFRPGRTAGQDAAVAGGGCARPVAASMSRRNRAVRDRSQRDSGANRCLPDSLRRAPGSRTFVTARWRDYAERRNDPWDSGGLEPALAVPAFRADRCRRSGAHGARSRRGRTGREVLRRTADVARAVAELLHAEPRVRHARRAAELGAREHGAPRIGRARRTCTTWRRSRRLRHIIRSGTPPSAN